MIISYIILFFLVWFLFKLFKQSYAIKNWNHLFSNMNYDSESFYNSVEEILLKKEIKSIDIRRITLKEDGFLSHQRVYLEIKRGHFTFHICAAPFGTSYFFSYWLREDEDLAGNVLSKLPIVGPYFESYFNTDTYYKLDTDAMFRASVHQSVLSAIDTITEAKGIKALSESERYFDLRDKANK